VFHLEIRFSWIHCPLLKYGFLFWCFLAIAILILGIAYVNYLNLSPLISQPAIKEIKMRKILGARSGNWRKAFHDGNPSATLTSLRFQLCVCTSLAPFASRFFGTEIWFASFANTTEPSWLLLLIIGFAPWYQRFYVVILSGKLSKKSHLIASQKVKWLRKSSVVFSVLISIWKMIFAHWTEINFP